MDQRHECLDGNEAAARIAYALSEVISIYPITPASPMAEHCDDWAAAGRPNLWGKVPDVVEMQSEAGAAGALHGALQKGALGTTFTASQGLLLMVPNMFKIAGELTPAVIHVAARTVATHALSIFGDHSDVMHARTTGWAMLAAGSVQEAHDFALVAHAATLRARVPFLHFFDGFRTSHEINKIAVLEADDIRAVVRDDDVLAFRGRGMTPDAPVVRGTAQNPDVFFQAREASNPFHLAVPGIVQDVMDELAARTGRRYGLVDYHGAPDAERVVIVMGSANGAVEETVDTLVTAGERVGMLRIRLFQPFPAEQILAALPTTVRAIAVLDRTKEPGAVGEPLYLGVVASARRGDGRRRAPVRHGTAGDRRPVRPLLEGDDARDDQADLRGARCGSAQAPLHGRHLRRRHAPEPADRHRLPGSPSTGRGPGRLLRTRFGRHGRREQGVGQDHRRGHRPVRAGVLRLRLQEVGVGHGVAPPLRARTHPFDLPRRRGRFRRLPPVRVARQGQGARVRRSAVRHSCSTRPSDPTRSGLTCPAAVQEQLLDKDIDLWVIDALSVAEEAGMGSRINTVMQPCFFHLAGILPADEAIARIKAFVEKTYAKRGEAIVQRNFAAIDRSLARLARVTPGPRDSSLAPAPTVLDDLPDFVARITSRLIAGEGDLLPVSALPVDGTFPTGTAKYEKRAIAQEIPIWDPAICIDCGKCAMVCPHATIRMKVFPSSAVESAPVDFLHKEFRSRDLLDHRLTIQVAPDDCTGCGVCVDVCPAKSKTDSSHKAINMEPVAEHRDVERPRWEFFQSIAPLDRSLIPHGFREGQPGPRAALRVLGSLRRLRRDALHPVGQPTLRRPDDRGQRDGLLVDLRRQSADHAVDGRRRAGRGPAWNNSLFEDNAEFGLGMRLALDAQTDHARLLLSRLAPQLGADLVDGLLGSVQETEADIGLQRERVAQLRDELARIDGPGASDARHLLALAGDLVRKGVWIIGGDGWAYDIGFGGVDQVLSSGRNVNILVLDTEVYSNTGGQASKATPRGAVAKFAAAGKGTAKKDLGAIARSYGNVFVAQVSMGANDLQTTKALLEADAWPGPSLVIAYSTCIAHGIDMSKSMTHQKDAVKSGYWPLYRFRPSEIEDGKPFKLDSSAPTIPIADFVATETRFAVLQRTHPERAAELAALAQADADERWRYYEQLAGIERTVPHVHRPDPDIVPEVESDAGYRYESEGDPA